MDIRYGYYRSAVGEMIFGWTGQGLCWLGFMVEGMKGNGEARMRGFFPKADFIRDDAAAVDWARRIMACWEKGEAGDIPLDLHGTPFQMAVWHALLSIPRGKVCSYNDIANRIGRPGAARAVGGAVGANPVSLLVPCHRVLNADGRIGSYGWGAQVKAKLLEAEGYRTAA